VEFHRLIHIMGAMDDLMDIVRRES
jgi:hypothetical protein